MFSNGPPRCFSRQFCAFPAIKESVSECGAISLYAQTLYVAVYTWHILESCIVGSINVSLPWRCIQGTDSSATCHRTINPVHPDHESVPSGPTVNRPLKNTSFKVTSHCYGEEIVAAQHTQGRKPQERNYT